jgi:hypothetical protein
LRKRRDKISAGTVERGERKRTAAEASKVGLGDLSPARAPPLCRPPSIPSSARQRKPPAHHSARAHAVEPSAVRLQRKIAGGFAAAQLTSDYVDAAGIRLPSKRRAYTRGPDRRPISEMLVVSIDISDVSFTLRFGERACRSNTPRAPRPAGTSETGCGAATPLGPEWVISGCAGPSAARQVNLKKRLPELDRADLKLRNLLAGSQQCSA